MGNIDVDRIQVASPCSMPWDQMVGDDQIRHCEKCQLNVYNLSTMTTEEITTILAKKEGRTCVRFYRRADGTVLTQDCPVGLAAVRRRLRLIGTAVATALLAAIPALNLIGPQTARSLRRTVLGDIPVISQLLSWVERSGYRPSEIQGELMALPRGQWTSGDPVVPQPHCQKPPPTQR